MKPRAQYISVPVASVSGQIDHQFLNWPLILTTGHLKNRLNNAADQLKRKRDHRADKVNSA